MSRRDKVTFFYPSRRIGGAQFLFARLAEHLSRCLGWRVSLVDYRDGALARRCENAPVQLIEYREGERTFVEDAGVLVAPPSHVHRIGEKLVLDRASTLFFWFIHPYNLVSVLPGFNVLSRLGESRMFAALRGLYRAECRSLAAFIEVADELQSLAFMDAESLRANRDMFGVRLPAPNLLPIPLEDPPAGKSAQRRRIGDVSVAWLGTIGAFKTNVLRRLLEDFRSLDPSTRGSGQFHVIGGGDDKEKLQGEFGGAPGVRFEGSIEGEALTSFLVEHADVVFAMGTSALEGARLGIPTILVDFSYGKVPADYRYRWLRQTEGFVLGRAIGGCELAGGGGLTMEQVLSSVRDRGEVEGERARAYFQEHHSLEAVSGMLVKSLRRARLTYRELVECHGPTGMLSGLRNLGRALRTLANRPGR